MESPWRLCLLALLACVCVISFLPAAIAGLTKPSIRVSGDLHDVEDSEEDEEWREWGRPKSVPKEVYQDGKVNFAAAQRMSAAHMKAPAWGFIKLKYDPHRSRERALELGHAWTSLMLTAHVHAKFFVLDINTLYVRLDDERQIGEVVEFVLEQEDGYELKFGDQLHRRPGAKPSSEIYDDPNVWKETERLNKGLTGAKGRGKKAEL